jgi:hypothetical protein
MAQEDKLFFLGLLSLIFSLFLFPFAVYLFPAVWLGWDYLSPDFVVDISLWIQTTFNLTYAMAFHWFFRSILFLAIFFGAVAYFLARRTTHLQRTLEAMEQGETPDASESEPLENIKEGASDSFKFFLKMVVIISLVFVVGNIMQWAISISQGQA